MTQENEQESFAVSDADFDALYRGEPGFDGADLSFDRVPWDIGGPQPEVVDLERAGEFRGAVLDVGCGPGDNAIFLARSGYTVTGVDGSATALDDARRRAQEQDADVRFVVDDVTSLEKLDQRFDTVLDSALYHCLGDDQRRQYSAALHRVTRPDATLHLFCFADEGPGSFQPMKVSKENLRTNLGEEWEISSLDRVLYLSRMTREDLESLASQNGGVLGDGLNPDETEVDDQGRVMIPVWRVRARRR